ncbi:uncharacterized protein LOC115898640 [Rhinopithecus roxellana]|uniref:uncharacterized protein LOC108540320 n=1 Tax=Rhinopithecus bieti TaxID=61621 RepID=UPI00083BF319|nr:PREDICTED: uncharacterized protein LOC108540320 [Rhinopithecus bieti]XP_030789518.1 uncharacterized protein LOC115898640 [Rhinopithecus roxellana]
MAEFSEGEERIERRYHCAEVENVPEEIQEAICYYCCKMAELSQEPEGPAGVRSYNLEEDPEEEGEGSSDMPGPSTTTDEEDPSMKGRKRTTCEAKGGATDELRKVAKKIRTFIQQNSERRKAGRKSHVIIFHRRNSKKRDENKPNEYEQSQEDSATSSGSITSNDTESPLEDQDLSHL